MTFLDLLRLFELFAFYLDFFAFEIFFSKFLRLILKVTKFTTSHQKLPKIGPTKYKKLFFACRAKKALAKDRSPLQELEEGPRSGPHLLVLY